MEVNVDHPRPMVTVFSITQDCRHLLQRCARDEQLTGIHWAQNRLSDFNLWDAGVGASAKEQHSLETHLRDDNAATKFVISSLSTLRTWLEIYCESVDEPRQDCGVLSSSTAPESNARCYENISKDEAKDSIEQLFQVLAKLGVAIRQAGAASHLKNADSGFHKRREEYRDFEAEMASILIWKKIRHMLAEGLEVSGVQQKYDEMQKEMKKQIEEDRVPYETQAVIEANARRRHRFAFAVKRADKLMKPSVIEEKKIVSRQKGAMTLEPVTLKDDSTQHGTVHQKHTSSGIHLNAASAQQSKLQSEYSKSSTAKLSTHKPDNQISELLENDRPLAPPTVTTSKVDYPSAPRLDPNANLFTCPYCRITIPKAMAQGSRWVKHVSDDLRPYTCYLPRCPEVQTLFATFQAWKIHVFSGHKSLPKWECMLCDPADIFSDKDSFTKHAQLCHSDELEGESVDDLVEACEFVEEPILDKCPICSIHEDTWLKKRASDQHFDLRNSTFIEHIGACIHEFSLLALPTSAIEDAVKERSAAPTGASNLDSRSSLSSLTFSDRGQDYPGFGEVDKSHLDKLELLPRERINSWFTNLGAAGGPFESSLDDFPLASDDDTDEDENSLRPLVADRLVKSAFESTPFKFMPEGVIQDLITEDIIRKTLYVTEPPSEEDNEMIHFIETRAKKTFAIVVLTRPSNTKRVMELLRRKGIDDSRLPIKDRRKLGRRPWAAEFYDDQWKFFAPIFSTHNCPNDLAEYDILPFVSRNEGFKKHSFGLVSKYLLHRNHMVPALLEDTPFAVKEIKEMEDEPVTERWQNKVEAFRNLNRLNQEHIVRFVTAFRRQTRHGKAKCFLMFEWADGGNLFDLWQRMPSPILTARLVKDVIQQILGLAKALEAAHSLDKTGALYRHGHINSSNILVFYDNRGLIGTWKFDGWGEARKHDEVVEMRCIETQTIYGTRRYEAPDAATRLRFQSFDSAARPSRPGDIWSIGCVILEIIIWLLYGEYGVDQFQRDLEHSCFYQISEINGRRFARVHDVVERWMDQMEKDPRCKVDTTAIGDLLEIVRTGLLVVKLPQRLGPLIWHSPPRNSGDFVSLSSNTETTGMDSSGLVVEGDTMANAELPVFKLTPAEPENLETLLEPPRVIGQEARFLSTEFRQRLEYIIQENENEAYWCIDEPQQ